MTRGSLGRPSPAPAGSPARQAQTVVSDGLRSRVREVLGAPELFGPSARTKAQGIADPTKRGSAPAAGVRFDCYKWNDFGQANANFSYEVTYPYAHQGQVRYWGAASNPLEFLSPPITWDMRTVLNTTNSNAPTAYVNYNHTCYPAHQIKVNGTLVYHWEPESNDFTYIAQCLAGINKRIGEQTIRTPVPTQ